MTVKDIEQDIRSYIKSHDGNYPKAVYLGYDEASEIYSDQDIIKYIKYVTDRFPVIMGIDVLVVNRKNHYNIG